MPRCPPRYLSATAPINVRRVPAAVASRSAPAVASHAERQRCRGQLGPGLGRQLMPARARGSGDARPARDWLLTATLAGVCAFVAMHVEGVWLALGLALFGVLVLALRARAGTGNASLIAGLEAEEIAAFDRCLAALAGELDDAQRVTLCEIKALIVDLAACAGVGSDAPHTLEDRLFAVACVRRYVPDSLAAFVSVPAARRSAPAPPGSGGAAQMLTRQLELLRAELRLRQARMAQSATARLLQQQRFLESKRTRTPRAAPE